MRIPKLLGLVLAFLALTAGYFLIPELEITDCRYVLATSDILIKTGGFDCGHWLSPITGLPLVQKYHFLLRSTDLPSDLLAAAKAAGVTPFGKSPGADYYELNGVAAALPGFAASMRPGAYPVLPRYPNWPSVLAAPVPLLRPRSAFPFLTASFFTRIATPSFRGYSLQRSRL